MHFIYVGLTYNGGPDGYKLGQKETVEVHGCNRALLYASGCEKAFRKFQNTITKLKNNTDHFSKLQSINHV